MTRHPRDLTYRKNDAVRAFKVAQKAGIPNPCIKIDRHGTITIMSSESPAKTNGIGNDEAEEWITQHASKA